MSDTATATVSDRLIALVRTVVPAAIGAALAWLAGRGLEVPSEYLGLLVGVATPAATGAYYAAARWASDRWPLAAYLLGYPAEPTYQATR